MVRTLHTHTHTHTGTPQPPVAARDTEKGQEEELAPANAQQEFAVRPVSGALRCERREELPRW